jgi:hypothetical protein
MAMDDGVKAKRSKGKVRSSKKKDESPAQSAKGVE